MLSPHEMRRLAFARYLNDLGVSQAKHPEPLSAASVLSFHDSIELFLRLAAEHVSAKHKPADSLLDLWDRVDEVLRARNPQVPFAHRGAIARLNDVRVGLKHRGLLPGRREVEESQAAALAVLSDLTPVIFDVSIDAVSLVDFVVHKRTRERLREAQTAIDHGDLKHAGQSAALALRALMDDYEDRKTSSWHGSPFSFGEHLRPPTELQHRLKRRDSKILQDRNLADVPTDFFEFFERLTEAIGDLRDGLRIVALGIDFRKYARFLTITPEVWTGGSDEEHVGEEPVPSTKDAASFCVDFVIEAAMKLQEFDF